MLKRKKKNPDPRSEAPETAVAPQSETSGNPEESETSEYSENSENSENSEKPESSENSENSESSEIPESSESSETPENTETSKSPEPDFAEAIKKAYCAGAGIDEATFEKAEAFLRNIAESVAGGKFDPEMIQLAIRMLNFNAERAAAIPHLSGTRRMGTARGDSIFDLARKAK